MTTTISRKIVAKPKASPIPHKPAAKPDAAGVGSVSRTVPKGSGHRFSQWVTRIAQSKTSERIKMIRKGVEAQLVFDASSHFEMSQATLSKLVGVSLSTVERKAKAGAMLGAPESDRLARIALIEREAAGVFGSPELAKEWLTGKNLALGEEPLMLLDTETGAEEVRRVLSAIAYGGVV